MKLWHRKRPGWKVWKWATWELMLASHQRTLARRHWIRNMYVNGQGAYLEAKRLQAISASMHLENLRIQLAAQATFAALCNKGCPR